MPLSFRSKLLASHVGLAVAACAIALFTLDFWLAADLERQLDVRMEDQARGAVDWAREGRRRHPERVAARIALIVDAEVTLFGARGEVLGASSQVAGADLGPEVETALGGAVGRASRSRAGQTIHYVAVPSPEGIVVRLAVPLSEVNATVDAMRTRLLFASTIAVGVALLLGLLASRLASRPLAGMTRTATRLARGDFDVAIDKGGNDEFGDLWHALESLAQQLKARIGELVAERDRLSAILSGMVEGVLVIDGSGRVLVENPAAAKILGAPAPLVGRSFEELEPNEDARRLIASCMRGEITETELEIVDGRGCHIAIYVRPLLRGGEGAIVAVLRDMTALRRLMAMRRDFVANVSHELRTPVTAIQGYSETLLRGTTDAETSRQFLEIVHRQAESIGALVEQLLTLSELEAREKDAIAREPVFLLSMARHVAETVRGRAESRGVTIGIEVDGDATARADPDGLERAVLNLVGNAIEYGREGGRVRIKGARAGAVVTVAVEDDGPGIAEEHLPRLFERFYRIDRGRARQHGGAGLGLSIVKHLVESMDGTIAVESEVGRGTTFTMKLPAA
jgi:two-component system, OmpR family, phosphate regulon sensor histidine kinase PhoR